MDARFRAVFYGARRIRGDIRERSVLTSRKSQHVQTILADPLAQVRLIDSALLDQEFYQTLGLRSGTHAQACKLLTL
jgi:hypothetical protein